MSYARNCPKCNKEIVYKNEKYRNQAEQHNKFCKTCSKIGRRYELEDLDLKVNCSKCGKEHHFKTQRWYNNFLKKNCLCKGCYYEHRFIGTFTRNCPKCGDLITYKDKNTCEKSNLEKKLCVSCVAKERMTDEVKSKISASTSGENNPMYGKSYYDIWVEKYGKEEAEIREKKKSQANREAMTGEKNHMYGRPSPTGSGNGWKGWYKGVYFASLKELFYLKYLFDNNIRFENGEQRKYKVLYEFNDGQFNYFLDFYLPDTNEYIEIKPKHLVDSPRNRAKFNAAKKIYGSKFKVLTEDDIEKVDIKTMYQLYSEKELIFLEKYEERFRNYCKKEGILDESN